MDSSPVFSSVSRDSSGESVSSTTSSTTPGPHVRVGVACLVTNQDHPGCVLMGVRKGSHGAGKFATPGGHLELDESWADCAIREVKEETNLDIENLRFHHVTNDPCIGGKREKHYITIFMRADIAPSSSPLENMEPHKCESWEWVPFADIVEFVSISPEVLFDPCVHLIQDGKLSL